MNPILTISCITYNHKNYIRQAIIGFLSQKTNFPFEIIIHDDSSNDGTIAIIKEFQTKYPDKIFPILQEENQFSKGEGGISTRFVWPKARGKYIALCEGDDYWIDPFKIQKQVDFLEKNKDFSICFHSVKIEKDGKLREDDITRDVPDSTDIYELAKGNFIHTPSIVFRKELLKAYPENFIKSQVGDYPLLMYLAQFGKIKKLEINAAVYRLHSNSMWNSIEKRTRRGRIIKYLELLVPYFAYDKMVFLELHKRWKKLSRSRIFELLKAYRIIEAFLEIMRLIVLECKFQVLRLLK
ncbi:MAG: glycosyltransferase [Bacteroidales bacterium]